MKTIEIINGVTKKPEWALAEPVNFSLEEGEHIAIIGRNGAGKSMFVDMITGRHPLFPGMLKYAFTEPYNNIKHITFRDTYGGDNDRTYFLQQRWNQMEIDPPLAANLKRPSCYQARIPLSAELSRNTSMNSSTSTPCSTNILSCSLLASSANTSWRPICLPSPKCSSSRTPSLVSMPKPEIR